MFETFLPIFNKLVDRDLDFHYLAKYPLLLMIVAAGPVNRACFQGPTLPGLFPVTTQRLS